MPTRVNGGEFRIPDSFLLDAPQWRIPSTNTFFGSRQCTQMLGLGYDKFVAVEGQDEQVNICDVAR